MTSSTIKRPVPVFSRYQQQHVKKLFNGMSAEEYHSRNAFPPGTKCTGCNRTKGIMTRIITLAELSEMRKRDPMMDALMMANPMAFQSLLLNTKFGTFIRLATAYACKACTPEAEKAASKHPSWVIVDIHRGPKPGRIVSGAYGTASEVD